MTNEKNTHAEKAEQQSRPSLQDVIMASVEKELQRLDVKATELENGDGDVTQYCAVVETMASIKLKVAGLSAQQEVAMANQAMMMRHAMTQNQQGSSGSVASALRDKLGKGPTKS